MSYMKSMKNDVDVNKAFSKEEFLQFSSVLFYD